MSIQDHVEIVKKPVSEYSEWVKKHEDFKLDLSGAHFRNADLEGKSIVNAKMKGFTFDDTAMNKVRIVASNIEEATFDFKQLTEVDFEGTDLTGSSFRGATLNSVKLKSAILTGVDFENATLINVDFEGARNVHLAKNLENTRVKQFYQGGPHLVPGEVKSFDLCERGFFERYLDWERIRIFGKLPLFGASYTLLVMIPVITYLLAFYNSSIEPLQEWAKIVSSEPENPLRDLGAIISDKLPSAPLPSQMFYIWWSTLFLAVASTLYALACPGRIKEFTREQWCHQLGKSLVNYWPLSWNNRRLRVICALCYFIGAVLALLIIVVKMLKALAFIWRYSEFSPWQFW